MQSESLQKFGFVALMILMGLASFGVLDGQI
jgi:hypothetical protein